MKQNIFQIMREKGHNYILPSDAMICGKLHYSLDEVGIFMHLYYYEDVAHYLSYIDHIPKGVNVYISVSDQDMYHKVKNYILHKRAETCHLIYKENRGRDVSALLVAFREYMRGYKYVCFVHDKKAKGSNELVKKETSTWIKSMWDNMLASENYINNIIGVLESNADLGLLVPPEMAGIWCSHAYTDMWKHDYKNTVELAENLELDSKIDSLYPMITVGTVFWCKEKAINKLLSKEWQYEDFHEEPLPLTGTFSHAVERILGYVAQDAGFETGYVMTLQYAQEYILQLKDVLREAYHNLNDVGVYSLARRELYNIHRKKIVSFMLKYSKVYFYGAGYFGKECYQIAVEAGTSPAAFLVSQKQKKGYLGLPTYTIDEIEMDEQTGILVTVGAVQQEEIVTLLENRGITKYMTIF